MLCMARFSAFVVALCNSGLKQFATKANQPRVETWLDRERNSKPQRLKQIRQHRIHGGHLIFLVRVVLVTNDQVND